jgi:hypothetical protein
MILNQLSCGLELYTETYNDPTVLDIESYTECKLYTFRKALLKFSFFIHLCPEVPEKLSSCLFRH